MVSLEKIRKCPPGLFTAGMAVYSEWMLHFFVSDIILWGRFAALTAFALGLGCVLGLVVSLIPRGGAAKAAAIALSAGFSILCLVEFFLSDAYGGFMSPATIVNGAGGVATDYLDVVLSLLVRNLWRLGLMLAPILAYALICPGRRVRWPFRAVLAAGALAAYLLGLGAAWRLTGDFAKLGGAYAFDSTTRCFGLHVALALELTHGSGTDAQPEFALSVPEVTQPEVTAPPEQTFSEPEPDYPENTLPQLDFAALAQQEQNSAVSSLHQYVSSLTPSRQNAYTGLLQGKNLILITAEALTKEAIDPVLTPTLYRLATQGIQFTDYYQPAWGASTISGEFSNLMGLVPTNGGMCMKEVKQQNFFLTMGHQMQKLGYWSAAYHNNSKDFYDRDQTHTLIGYDRFIALYGGLENVEPVWPESDWEMMVETLPQYIDQQPFSVYYMTVSGHSVYTRNGSAMARKHYDEVKDLPCSEPVKCYLAANLELEAAMKYLLEQLEAAGIADDTVIVMAADHYPYGLEKSSTWNNASDYLAELFGVKRYDQITRDHNALILWSGCLEGKNIVVDEPVYSLDILPTLSNLFGLPYDSRLLVGRDVFSGEMPLVLWPDFSWKTDKGTYNAQTGEYIPAPGQEDDPQYRAYVDALVQNKITYCRYVLSSDYFNYLEKALEP